MKKTKSKSVFKLLRLPDFLFVWITSFFFLGMALYRLLPNLYFGWFLLLFFPGFVLLNWSKVSWPILGKCTIALFFFTLGLVYNESNDRKDKHLYGLIETREADLLEGEIEEVKIGRGDWNQYVVRVDGVYCKDSFFVEGLRVLLYAKKKDLEINISDRMRFVNQLERIQSANYPGAFDAKSYWSNKGIQWMGFLGEDSYRYFATKNSSLKAIFSSWRLKAEHLFDRYLQTKESGLMKALVLGDKQGLDTDVLSDFSQAGAMHILAVSGLHVGILFALLLYVLSRFPRYIGKYLAFFLALAILILYACLTGGSPSIFRAVFMFALLGLGKVLGRSAKSINLLFFSAFVLVLLDANNLYDLGFQLSYLAVLGILLFYNWVVSFMFFRNKILQKLWEGTAVGIAATCFTFPLTIYIFHLFPSYFVLTNLLLMFLTELLLIAGILFILIGLLGIGLSWFAFLLKYVIQAMLWTVNWVSNLPYSVAQGFEMELWEVFAFLALILLLTFFLVRQYKFLKVTLGLLLLVCFVNVQRTRFQNLDKRECLFYPEGKGILALKEGEELHLFYADSNRFEKYKRWASEYTKVRPAKIQWHSMDQSDWRVTTKVGAVRISYNTKSWKVQLPEKCLEIVKSYEQDSLRIEETRGTDSTSTFGIHPRNTAYYVKF